MQLTQREYDICVFLSQLIYTKLVLPQALRPNHTVKSLSGLRADIFEFEEVTYVCFSGTNGFFAINDWIANISMALGRKPKQFHEALEFVSGELDQNKRTIFVGHSLGGALLEFVCNTIKHEDFIGVVFNGAGVRHLTKPKYPNNIFHFITTRDILNRVFLKWIPFRWFKTYFKHIGRIIYIEDKSWNGVKSHSNFELFEQVRIENFK